MRSFLQLLKKNGSILLIGLLIGLFCGFRLANAKFRNAQNAELNERATKAAANLGNPSSGQAGTTHAASQGEVTAALDRARANPNDYEAQLEAADLFLQIQRPESALPFLQQGLKLKPTDPRAITALSTCYLFLNQFNEAATWARKAVALKSDDLGAKLLLVLALTEARQDLDEADQLLRQIEAAKPGDKMLVEARASLDAARSGKSQAPAKTTLEHGPAAERPPGGGAR